MKITLRVSVIIQQHLNVSRVYWQCQHPSPQQIRLSFTGCLLQGPSFLIQVTTQYLCMWQTPAASPVVEIWLWSKVVLKETILQTFYSVDCISFAHTQKEWNIFSFSQKFIPRSSNYSGVLLLHFFVCTNINFNDFKNGVLLNRSLSFKLTPCLYRMRTDIYKDNIYCTCTYYFLNLSPHFYWYIMGIQHCIRLRCTA